MQFGNEYKIEVIRIRTYGSTNKIQTVCFCWVYRLSLIIALFPIYSRSRFTFIYEHLANDQIMCVLVHSASAFPVTNLH